MTGELTAGRADVILTQLTATSYREEFADQSFAIVDAKMALMVHADTLRPQGVQACASHIAPLPMACFSSSACQDIFCTSLHHSGYLDCH